MTKIVKPLPSFIQKMILMFQMSRNQHQTTKLKERLVKSLEERKFCRRQEVILIESASKVRVQVNREDKQQRFKNTLT